MQGVSEPAEPSRKSGRGLWRCTTGQCGLRFAGGEESSGRADSPVAARCSTPGGAAWRRLLGFCAAVVGRDRMQGVAGWFKGAAPEVSGSGLGKESCGDHGRTSRLGRCVSASRRG
jgi:hypothetical protein